MRQHRGGGAALTAPGGLLTQLAKPVPETARRSRSAGRADFPDESLAGARSWLAFCRIGLLRAIAREER
jgi:hypothetical protein